MMLEAAVRLILESEFRHVPDLQALLLEPDTFGLSLFGQIKQGGDLTKTSALAFEAFQNAADRIMVEAPRSPYLSWYGLLIGPRPGTEALPL